MRWRSALFGAIVALGGLLGESSSVAAGSASAARVVHVCDCPAAMAREERDELLRGFASLGYVQGRNLELTTYDVETLDGGAAQRPALSVGESYGPSRYVGFFTTTVARSQPQLVLASGVRVVAAARESGLAAPVVFWRITDPVGNGFVAALPRPGGNLTGFSRAIEKLTPKRLELLHEMVPRAQQVAFLFVADFPSHVRQASEVGTAARRVGVKVREYALPRERWQAAELDAVFATMRSDGVEALLLPDINLEPTLLVGLAARYRLPTIYSLSHVVTDWGGLAAYSTVATDTEDVVRYAVRILHGERPADLPVQEPTRFELVLNARAARDLGLTFPRSFVLRASQVVEK